jgi:hypothetical protein
MNATDIRGHTLVGFTGTPPIERGNCFTVGADNSKVYQIVNFGYENLEALCAQGLSFPIQIREIGPGVAVIDDERIGERWYRADYCTVCCPEELLPAPQLDKAKRCYRTGERSRKGTWISINLQVKRLFP